MRFDAGAAFLRHAGVGGVGDEVTGLGRVRSKAYSSSNEVVPVYVRLSFQRAVRAARIGCAPSTVAGDSYTKPARRPVGSPLSSGNSGRREAGQRPFYV